MGDADLNKKYYSIQKEMEIARKKALSNAANSEDSLHDRRVKFLAGAGLWYVVAIMVF